MQWLIKINVGYFKALKTEIISFLLNLLEKDVLEFVENIASVKAQIVKALKAMQLNPKYGEQVDDLTLHLLWKEWNLHIHGCFLAD